MLGSGVRLTSRAGGRCDGQKIVDALWRSRTSGNDFDGNGVRDIFSTATGTLTIWNGKGDNRFGSASAVGDGWAPYF